MFAAPLRFPIVLIHGFNVTSPEDGTLKFAQEFLNRMEVAYFTPQIPAYGSIEERSISLIEQIAIRYPHQNVHLFGHSMVCEWFVQHSDSSHALYRAGSMPETSPLRQWCSIWASE
jgi:hypothetical protein